MKDQLPEPQYIVGVIGLFVVALLLGMSMGDSSTYNSECSDLLESRTFKYSGDITEYSTPGLTDSIFWKSESGDGSVMLMESDQLAVENGSDLGFSFKQRIWIECTDGRISVEPYIMNAKFEDSHHNAYRRG